MSKADDPVAALSDREREVLALIAAGKTNVEIANELGIRFDTVKWHVSEILSKVGVERREDAAKAWRGWNRLHRRWGRAIGGGFGLEMAAKIGGGLAVVAAAVVAMALLLPDSDDDAIDLAGRILVAESSRTRLSVYDARTGDVVYETVAENENSFLIAPRFSPNGRHLVYLQFQADDDELRPLLISVDLARGDRYVSPPLSFRDVQTPTWSPDGTRVATGTKDLVVLDEKMELLTPAKEPDGLEGGGTIVEKLPWSADSGRVATWDRDEGITIADRDGNLFKVDLDRLSEAPPQGVGLDVRRDDLRFVTWEDDTSIRLLILRNGRVGSASDEPPDFTFEWADGRVSDGEVRWEPSVVATDEELVSAPGYPSPEENKELRERALALAGEQPDDFMAELMQSADGSTWVASIQRPGRQTERFIRVVILSEEPIVLEPGRERATVLLTGLASNLDVIVVPVD